MNRQGRLWLLGLLLSLALALGACRAATPQPATAELTRAQATSTSVATTPLPLPSPSQISVSATAGVGTAGPATIVSVPGPSASPTTTISATAEPGGGREVTLADDGRTITMAVGERFLLKLGEGFVWNVQVADQSVLSRVVNITVVRGAQGVYEAHKPGRTTLTATGDPPCRQATPPCGAASRVFTVTVVVN